MLYMKERLYRLLRWSERYTKTDMVYLAHGGTWLTFGQFVTAGASFVLSVAFANLVPQAVYGTYRYITSLAATLSAVSLTGMGTALVQSVARGFEGVIRGAFWMSVRWSVVLVLISFVGAIYYYLHGNVILSISLLFIGSFSPFLNSANLATYFANGKKDFARLSIYNIVKGVFPAVVLIGTLFLTDSVLVIIFTYFFANTVAALLVYGDALRFYKPNEQDDPGLLDYGKKLSVLNILSTIATHADKVLIFTSLGAVELAIYSVASAFPEQIRSALRNLNFLMVPKFAQKDVAERQLYLRSKLIRFAFVLGGIIVVYVFLAPLIYGLFFPKYPEAILLSQMLGLSIFTALSWVPYSILVARSHSGDLFKISTAGSLMQLTLLGIFIHFWGLWGVVVAKILGSYFSMILHFVFVQKHYEL